MMPGCVVASAQIPQTHQVQKNERKCNTTDGFGHSLDSYVKFTQPIYPGFEQAGIDS